MPNTYRFDVPVWATVRVVAESEPEARIMLHQLGEDELSIQMEEIENFELSPVASFGDLSQVEEGDLD